MSVAVEPGGGVAGEVIVAEPARSDTSRRPRWRAGISGAVLAVLYTTAIAAPWVALYPPNRQHRDAPNAPTSPIATPAAASRAP